MDHERTVGIKQESNQTWKSRVLSKQNIVLFIFVLIAFLLRLIFMPRETVIGWDGTYYANSGMRIMSGDFIGGISPYWSPVYSFLTGISSLLFQDAELGGRIVSLVAGSLLVVPAYFLLRDHYGRQSAFAGTVLITLHPMLIRSSAWVLTESVYTLVFITIVLVGWRALKNVGTRSFFLTGLLLGVAYLLKPEAIGFVGLFFVMTLCAKLFRPHINFRRFLTGNALMLLGFAVFLLPYVILIHQKTGSWTISQKFLNNTTSVEYEKGLSKLTDDGRTTKTDEIFGDLSETRNSQGESPVREASSPASDVRIKLNIAEITARIASQLTKELKQFLPETFPFIYPFLLIALIGFFYKPWTRSRIATEIYLISFFVFTLLGYAATVIQVRYLVPLIPIMICWVSVGIVGLSDWAMKSASSIFRTDRKLNPIFMRAFTLIILVAVLLFSYPAQMAQDRVENLPFEEKQAGLWIKDRAEAKPLIMAASPIPGFYASCRHTYLPDEEFSTVLDYAKRKGVNYIIFAARRLKDTPNAFPPDEQPVPEGLELVYKNEQNPAHKIVIYKILSGR